METGVAWSSWECTIKTGTLVTLQVRPTARSRHDWPAPRTSNRPELAGVGSCRAGDVMGVPTPAFLDIPQPLFLSPTQSAFFSIHRSSNHTLGAPLSILFQRSFFLSPTSAVAESISLPHSGLVSCAAAVAGEGKWVSGHCLSRDCPANAQSSAHARMFGGSCSITCGMDPICEASSLARGQPPACSRKQRGQNGAKDLANREHNHSQKEHHMHRKKRGIKENRQYMHQMHHAGGTTAS